MSWLLGPAALCIGFVWGALTIRNHLFPYNPLRRLAGSTRRLLRRSTGAFEEAPTRPDAVAPSYDLLFIGDSLVYGGDWERYFPGARIYNGAMMGETTWGALRYIESMAVLGAPRAVVMLGAKDFESVGYRCATTEDLDATMRNFDTIVSTIRRHGADVTIMAALQVNDQLRGSYPNPHIRALNARLEGYAKEIGASFIDLNADLSGDSEGLRACYTYDGIKLTDEAYAIWAERLRGVIGRDL
ncbi:GDSL-type esterase/lipase family protein [Magnetospirillum sp. 64-120]|uniref:GDSL-type esterase/lipase family protein n=1 Tax=Magnetospirillum sp. 64-120 TaxID=1895778 RepID=UPI0025BB47E0|nr:GDSL-type esterase/lipase family protein [Magnetospirillum sp. 64-120]